MMPGYGNFALLVLSAILLAMATDAYSDVDLRIAERKAIPHYIRHSYEYPDIDIKKIMQQRGILPRENTWKPPQQQNRETYFHQAANFANNRNRPWKPHSKTATFSNHIQSHPNENRYFMKKVKYFKSFPGDYKMKMKNRFW